MAITLNAFPLTIVKDQISLDESYRDHLIKRILAMRAQAPEAKAGASWTGDVHGFEFLHKDPDFDILSEKLAEAARAYMRTLSVNADRFIIYFTRSWATVARGKERIAPHAHMQSHISLAYYLQKPPNAGNLVLHQRVQQNEFIGSLFAQRMIELGVVEQPSPLNSNQISIEAEEGDVIVFPSKTEHSTSPNLTDLPRISIAVDVIAALRDSERLEWGLPDIGNWKGY